MSKLLAFCFSLLTLLAGASGVAQDVQFSSDPTVNFSKFKTYEWTTLNSPSPIDKLTDEQIKSAVDAALPKRGLAKVAEGGTADLVIGYQTNEILTEQFARIPNWDSTPRAILQGDLHVHSCEPRLGLERRS